MTIPSRLSLHLLGPIPPTAPEQVQSPAEREHARRKAWGAKWGPLVGASIRAALAEHDAAGVRSLPNE